MDDLISRKATLDAIKDPVVKGYAMSAILNAPSVPAVPLDKLCEWLADKALPAPCYYVEDYCPYEDFGHCDKDELPSVKDCWKMVLTKWMEGLDAAD